MSHICHILAYTRLRLTSEVLHVSLNTVNFRLGVLQKLDTVRSYFARTSFEHGAN